MKKEHAIVLSVVCALGAVTLWVCERQHERIQLAESRNQKWRTFIEPYRTEASSADREMDGDPMVWEAYRGKPGLWMGGYEGMRLRTRLQNRLHQLDTDQLCDALEGVIAADIGSWERESLAWMIVEILIQHDPALALQKYGASLKTSDGTPLHPMATALKQWARKDPAAAIDWYDAAVRDGVFWGKELHEVEPEEKRYELHLISGLVDADLAAAKQRMTQIKAMMSPHDLGNGVDIDAMEARNFASLVRAAYEDPKDQMSAIVSAGSKLTGRDGYAAITSYMDEVGATTEERARLIEAAVQYTEIRSLQDVQKARQWVGVQAPEQLDEMTGKMILRVCSGSKRQQAMSFGQAGEMALTFKSDKVLSAFLISYEARSNKDASLELAANIADEKLREEVLGYLR